MKLESLQTYIAQLREWIDSHAAPIVDPDKQNVLSIWREQISAAERLLQEKPELPIAFLGPSQQGKSSLINAILGANILPVGGAIGACTSVITSVHYRFGKGYRAEIEFISLDEWKAELIAIQRTTGHRSSGEDTEVDRGELEDIRKSAVEKFAAVYCDDSLDHISTLLRDRHLGLPYDVSLYMAKGQPLLIEEDKVLPLRNKISRYLVGRQKHHEPQFWPLISRVRIYADFDVLARGAILVDLPGLNDPNPAREQVTKRYLQDARHIWLVCNSQAGIDRVFTQMLGEERLLLRLFLEGRLGVFSVIATRVDDINIDAVLHEMGIDPEHFDGNESAVLEYRREQIAKYVKNHLTLIAQKIVENAAARQHQESFIKRIGSIPVFSVSTAAYLYEKGLMPLWKGMKLSVEETHIPKLIGHLDLITSSENYSAQIEASIDRLRALAGEINDFFLNSIEQIDLEDHGARQQWAALIPVVNRTILDSDKYLQQIKIHFEEVLHQRCQAFDARLAEFDEQATAALAAVCASWQSINWRSLQAAVQRQGVWFSRSLQKEFNLNRDVARAYLDLLPFVWEEFFGTHLSTLTEDVAAQARAELHKTAERLRGAMDMLRYQPAGIRESMEASLATASESFRLQSKQVQAAVNAQIQRTRHSLSNGTIETAQNFMMPAYSQANKLDAGAGVKARILEIITHHAKKNSGALLINMRQELAEGVSALQASMKPQLSRIVSYGADILSRFKQNVESHEVAVAPELRNNVEKVLDNLPQLTASDHSQLTGVVHPGETGQSDVRPM